MRAISVHTCASVIRKFRDRLDLLISNNGRHLEHVFSCPITRFAIYHMSSLLFSG